MENLMTLDFEVMWRDRVVGHVVMENGVLMLNENYSEKIWENPFRLLKTGQDVRATLAERVICLERFDDDMKKVFGIDKWDVLSILKNTHGVDFDDYTWPWFKGEVSRRKSTQLNSYV